MSVSQVGQPLPKVGGASAVTSAEWLFGSSYTALHKSCELLMSMSIPQVNNDLPASCCTTDKMLQVHLVPPPPLQPQQPFVRDGEGYEGGVPEHLQDEGFCVGQRALVRQPRSPLLADGLVCGRTKEGAGWGQPWPGRF